MREFKIGDKVKVINKNPWESLLGGKIGTIKAIYRGVVLLIQFKEGMYYWARTHNVELLPQSSSIHITTDGTETYAILKENGKVVKKSVAKCSKDDEFDFRTGVNIAIDRLFEKKKEGKNNLSIVFGNDWGVIIKKGKVYDFVNGYATWDNGNKSLKYDNFDDLKKYMGDWKPFKIKKVKRQAKVGEYVQVVGGIKFTNEEGKTTQSGDICIQSKNYYGGYERFKNIDNDMEIILTNMYTPEYLVLEGYEKYIEYIEEKKKKAEFKPYLTFDGFSDFYGNIGDETSQVDVLGNRLKVGDTVDLYCGTELRCETSVVKDANVKTDFVMGLRGTVFSNGKAGDWTIIKNRSHEDVQDGETVGCIKYIKTILKSNN